MTNQRNKTEAQVPREQSGKECEKDGATTLRELVARWQKQHSQSVEELCATLHEPDAAGPELSLLRAAAHDLIVLNNIGESEVALSQQVALFASAGNPKHIVLLTRALSDLSRLRTEATRRTTELMKVTATLAARREHRAQQGTIRRTHLRSVG